MFAMDGKEDGYIAWHGYQSFKPDEITAKEAHEIGLQTAREMWSGRYQIIVTTHLDKDHLHNYFCFNSVSFIDGEKYDLEKFIAKVKKVTEVKELTPELVYEFISRIEVHKPYRENGVRYQQLDIYYHGVGIIRLATAEEMEESFQRHIANKEQNKQKTA